jgi:tetratricopeptide (TPR) repeat protein
MTEKDLESAKSIIEHWIAQIDSGLEFDKDVTLDFMTESRNAEKIIKDILKKEPANQEAKIELARWHLCQAMDVDRFKDGKNKAIMHMMKVVEIVPNSASYRRSLGILYSQAGKKDLAIEQIEKAIELEPENIGFQKELEDLKAEKGGGCFIATAVYDSPHSLEVELLRKFRDETLLTSQIGRIFVNVYYFLSPPVANFISDKKTIKYLLKFILFKPFIKLFIPSNKVLFFQHTFQNKRLHHSHDFFN